MATKTKKTRKFDAGFLMGIEAEVARFSFEHEDIRDYVADLIRSGQAGRKDLAGGHFVIATGDLPLWLHTFWAEGFEDLVADTPEFAHVPGIYVELVKHAANVIDWKRVATVLVANLAK